MSDEQKLLAACGDYRAKLDKLEAENTALWESRARLWDECADWHEAYCSVGDALGVNEPEYSGRDFFAELVKELVAENAALRADRDRLDWLMTQKHIRYPFAPHDDGKVLRERIDAAMKEAQP
jgi:hypothetical protein